MNDWDPGDFKRRQQEGVWHVLNRLMVTLILFAAITLVICAFLPELKRQRDYTARLDQLKSDIDKQRMILGKNTRAAELLKNDSEYIEFVARDLLDWMKEGETIFRFESAPPDTSGMRRELVP